MSQHDNLPQDDFADRSPSERLNEHAWADEYFADDLLAADAEQDAERERAEFLANYTGFASGNEGRSEESLAENARDEAEEDHEPASSASSGVGERRRGGSFISSILVVVVGLALVRLSVGPIVEEVQYALTRGRERASSEIARTQLARLSQTADAFRLVAQSVGPSVVHIDVKSSEPELSHIAGDLTDDEEIEMFSSGQGSGVIVDEDGYVLTNYHVVHGADRIDVTLSDNRRISGAEIVGFDAATDLAVLRINATGLVSAPWGNSDHLEVGDWVLAVGNPFGLDRSVTAGIVSGKQRRQVVPNLRYQDFLQTDAAVNPGNSGGPLVNLRGEVIGINTAIVGKAYRGISFAIPSQIARETYDDLKASGSVVRGWLGVSLANLTDEEAGTLGVTRGARVESVVGLPARDAGIEIGDVIISWDDRRIHDSSDLSLQVARTPVNATVEVVLMRGGEETRVQVKVARQP